MFARRSLLALNRTALATNLGRTSVRAYTTTRGTSYSGYESHNEIEVGDLVTYVEAGNKTEGIVQKIFEESSKTNKNPAHMAEIQNYYSRKLSYSDLGNLKSVARHKEAKDAKETNQAKPTTTKTTTAATPAAAKTATTTAAKTATTKIENKATPESTKATANSPQQPLESKAKINEQLKAEDSPLNADFAPGDIVRYRVASNFTAGVVLDVVYKIEHDEHGNFHGASKENPMAKLENLWTKKITYHHLNVLEHVKRARDVTPGRFAESEYEVYDKK